MTDDVSVPLPGGGRLPATETFGDETITFAPGEIAARLDRLPLTIMQWRLCLLPSWPGPSSSPATDTPPSLPVRLAARFQSLRVLLA